MTKQENGSLIGAGGVGNAQGYAELRSTPPTPYQLLRQKYIIEDPSQLITNPRYPDSPEEWPSFPLQITHYFHEGKRGERWLMGGWSVMEEWERGLQKHMVTTIMHHIHSDRPRVLIRGEGPGYATDEMIDQMRGRGGGEIHLVELHPDVMRLSEARVAEKLTNGDKLRIKIFRHLGEAIALTKELPSDYFDGVLSDTFPLNRSQKNMNDFLDGPQIVRVLKDSGVMIGFIGLQYPNTNQIRYYLKHFRHQNIQQVPTDPPNDCKYYRHHSMSSMMGSLPKKDQLIAA